MAWYGGSSCGRKQSLCHAKGPAILPLKETDTPGQHVHAEMVQLLKCWLAEDYKVFRLHS